jgi:hypothetical protein
MTKLALLAAVLALAACSGSSGSSDMSTSTPEALPTCIVGWWLRAPVPCSSAWKTPEIAAADCQRQSFVGFDGQGNVADGVYNYSASIGTVSTPQVVRQTYTLTATTLQILPGMHVSQGVCTASTLSLDSQVQQRAPQNIADALTAGTANGASSFTSVPVH